MTQQRQRSGPRGTSGQRGTSEQRRSKGQRDRGSRERLLLATRRCVRERGVAATSSRAIADAADVNLGAITYYFGSKRNLVATALADELRDWVDPALEHLRGADDPVRRLFGAMTVLGERFDAEHDRIPGLLEIFVQAARDPAARGPIVAIWVDVKAQLAATLDELRTRGAIPTWVEPLAMATLVVAVVAGVVVDDTVDPDGVGHRDVAAQLASLLVTASTTWPASPR